MREFLVFRLCVAYAKIYDICKRRFGIQLRGLGWLLRHLRESHDLTVHGCPIRVESALAFCYGRLFAGEWNEPETHKFLHVLIDSLDQDACFVDVGANVGEMVLDVARKRQVIQTVAVEPIGACVEAIQRAAVRSGISNLQVVHAAAGAADGLVNFYQSQDVSNSRVSASGGEPTPVVRLDGLALTKCPLTVLLLDVEGFEVEVLRGAPDLLKERRPVLVFEYNFVSKLSFSLADINALLASEYSTYRLRSDGLLDAEVEDAWNCVALPNELRDRLPTAVFR